MAQSWKLKEQQGVLTIEFDKPDTEVNTLSTECMIELKNLLIEVGQRTDLKAVRFTSAKSRIFIAGADINEINGIHTKEDAILKADMGKEVFQLIEDLKIPTVCVINGACLGGGYELALACSHRVASTSDNVRIGLPEVNLGILPGFGGSIRLPRLLGLAKSLPLILAGKMVRPKQAFKLGMVDRLFAPDDLGAKSFQFALRMGDQKAKAIYHSPFNTWLEKAILGPLLIYSTARKNVLKRTKGHYPAPLETIKLIQKTYGMSDLGQAFKEESLAFSELATTEVSKNLIKLFFMNERYKKRKWTDIAEKFEDVKQCAVIGAGVMGGGIAQLTSSRDIPTEIKDINEKALEGALNEAKRIYAGAVERKRLKEAEMEKKMALISTACKDEDIAKSDFFIEAVVENLEIKQKVFKEWSDKASPEAILASNTSSLSVTKMAEVCSHPERVVGVHFFNPVNRMPLVEVIRAEQSSPATVEKAVQFSRKLGKLVIVTADAPGFLVNRLLLPYLNEAAFLLEDGVGPQELDKIACKFGMPMGPIELVDQVGIDVGYKVAHILEDAFGERMKVASILQVVMDKGLLGKKSDKGFYLYAGRQKTVNPDIAAYTKADHGISEDEICKRLIYIMINEAARCLDENVIDEAATVDMGMIMGTGFPPFRAGLLNYADSVGLQNVVKDLQNLSKKLGAARFEPCDYLKKLAEAGKGFYPSN